MSIAITREVSRSIVHCELTHLERTPIDVERAREQHRLYCSALRALELEVIQIPEAPDLPDSVFVEDTAIVLDEAAVITNPGADSRKAEVEPVVRLLQQHRPLLRITPPATLDGGDVLVIGRKIFVGQTPRSNSQAVAQLQQMLGPYGCQVNAVPVTGCLHLKSAVTQVAENTLLINSAWVEKSYFEGFEFMEIDPSEPFGANALLVKGTLIYPSAYPRTRSRLESKGLHILPVEADELAKAEGGVTCCSLILQSPQ
jgi:dimethylargininase